MKSIIVSIMLCLLSISAYAYIPVEITSSNYYVGGYYRVSSSLEIIASGSYYASGTTPQANEITYGQPIDLFATASSSNEPFGVSSYSIASPGAFSYAFAQTDVTFRPLIDTTSIRFESFMECSGGPWFGFQGYIVDLTDNTVIWNPMDGLLLDYALPDGLPGAPLPVSYSSTELLPVIGGSSVTSIEYNFKADHLYGLHMLDITDANKDQTIATFSFPDLVSVPEPSTLALLGFGIVMLVISRRIAQAHRKV